MKSLLILGIAFFLCAVELSAEQIILKINTLRGDSFSTPEADIDAIKSTFRKAFLIRGDTVFEPDLTAKATDSERLFYADVFIYQFPNDEPGMSLTIRKNEKVHLLVTEKRRVFGNPKLAFSKLAKLIVEEIPAQYPEIQVYKVAVDQLLSQEGPRIGNTRGMTKAVSSNYRERYNVSLLMSDAYDKPYPFEGDFGDYFPYCLDMKGFRNRLKGETLSIAISINEVGMATVEKIDTPSKLKDKHLLQIHHAVESIPLLLTKGQSRDATITVEVS